MVARKAVTALLVVVVALWTCDFRRSEVTSVSATKEIQTMEAARSHAIPIPPIDAAAPASTETATFALGWFWGPDARFGITDGVSRTRVGYAGGSKEHPTYHALGDHAESVQIDYDPTRISYRDLLDIFWQTHTPTRRSWSRQYASIIFFQDEKQKRLAIETRDREEERRGSKIYTEILPFSRFYLAEAYHQKYRLQQEGELMREFTLIYPDPLQFVESTAAARVNGYVSGYGTRESLKRELGTLGLSSEAERTLVKLVSSSSPH